MKRNLPMALLLLFAGATLISAAIHGHYPWDEIKEAFGGNAAQKITASGPAV